MYLRKVEQSIYLYASTFVSLYFISVLYQFVWVFTLLLFIHVTLHHPSQYICGHILYITAPIYICSISSLHILLDLLMHLSSLNMTSRPLLLHQQRCLLLHPLPVLWKARPPGCAPSACIRIVTEEIQRWGQYRAGEGRQRSNFMLRGFGRVANVQGLGSGSERIHHSSNSISKCVGNVCSYQDHPCLQMTPTLAV